MPLDLEAIAEAVKQVESSGGTNIGPRYEPGFQRRYLQGKPRWEALAKQYGWQAVSSSYGPWQIMFPVAVELGFTGSPQQLADPVVNRQYFDKKFQRDYQATGGHLEKSLLRYNGGGDPTYPQRVFKFLHPSPKSPVQPGGRMPTLDQMKLEGPEVHEKISQQLYRMDQNLQAMGLGPMSPEDLRSVYGKIKTGVVQVVSQHSQTDSRPDQSLPPPPGSRVFGSPPALLEGAEAMQPFSLGDAPVTEPFGTVVARPEYPGDYLQLKRRPSNVLGPI